MDSEDLSFSKEEEEEIIVSLILFPIVIIYISN